MIDANETEMWAITHGGNMGGQFLDELRITDFSRMTQGQYQTFIRCIISGYLGEMARLQSLVKPDSKVPF